LLRLLGLWALLGAFLFANTLTPLTLQLAWKYQFQFAGYIMAKEKGFYEAARLDVSLNEYKIGMSTTSEFEEGRAHFGIGRTQLILDRLNHDKRYVQLLALAQASPVMIQTTAQSGIKTLKDFRGKRIATSGDVTPMLIADILSMFSSAGLTPNDFTFVPARTYGPEDITSGYADAITAYAHRVRDHHSFSP
jgi:polar amino acid transport system substrate-binding protein